MSDQGGVKHDNGKLRYDLIPPEALEEVVKVLTYGSKKYGDRNWEKGIKFSRNVAAAKRHEAAFLKGQLRDEETLTVHLANTIVNYLMVLQFIKLGRQQELDDLPNADVRNDLRLE